MNMIGDVLVALLKESVKHVEGFLDYLRHRFIWKSSQICCISVYECLSGWVHFFVVSYIICNILPLFFMMSLGA